MPEDMAGAMAMLGGDSVGSNDAAIAEAPTQVDAGATSQDSFSSVDPNTLAPELQSIYKNMQADYTRKTQDAAPWRTTFADVSADPSEVRNAYEFWNNLNSNVDYAKDVYAQLGEALKPYQADAAAATADTTDSDFSDPVAKQVAELSSQLQSMQETQRYQAGAAELQRQEMALRAQHADWKDEDFNTVYQLALAHDGNLVKAAQTWDTTKNSIITGYLNQKAAVDTTTAPVNGFNGVDIQTAPATFKDASRAAAEYFRNIQA